MGDNHVEHAVHNEKVCNYLKRHEAYSDWVVIVAFYSAMHYVRHLMVPQEIGGVVYDDFEEIYQRKKLFGEGRHGFQKAYVLANHREIHFQYRRLHEMSEMARYQNYDFTREQAKEACGYLETIKLYAKDKI